MLEQRRMQFFCFVLTEKPNRKARTIRKEMPRAGVVAAENIDGAKAAREKFW
jgi:hypothetical protein